MNERIKELAEQAGFCGTGFHNTLPGTTQEDALKNFAELLIQECVRCAEGEWIRNGDTEHNRAVSGVIESIKERFGVEQN